MISSVRLLRNGGRQTMVAALTAGMVVLAACANSDTTSATTSSAGAGTMTNATATTGSTTAGEPGSVSVTEQTGTEVARAELSTPDGRAVGTATFSTVSNGAGTLLVRVSASGLQPGFKGFHVHTFGRCEPNSSDPANPANVGNFLSAGGHLKTQGENHAGHDGDMTSLQVRSDGTAELVTGTDSLPLDVLLDADGSAVIIHLGPDNFGNIPTRYAPTPDTDTLNTGDSGGRAACGVVEAV